VPLGFVVLKAGVTTSEQDVAAELVERVRENIGAFACFRTALVVRALPKTRSGKILRGTMKKIADGLDYTVPATIEDAAVLADVGERLRTSGFPARELIT
jgi:propionyl-CoA synthetase